MILIFKNPLLNQHIFKDVGEIPYYLAKQYNEKTNVLCLDYTEIPKGYRGFNVSIVPRYSGRLVKIPKVGFLSRFKNIYSFVIFNAKNEKNVMIFHCDIDTLLISYLYKLINPKAKIYVKMDTDEKFSLHKVKGLKYKIIKKMIDNIDLFSVETSRVYDDLKKDFFGENNKKLFLVPNGFDSELSKTVNKKTFEQKENIMITVGRLGTYQKNTELLLAALEQVELKDWKFYLIGSVEPEFEKKIEEFYRKYPSKKENIIFTGNLDSKEELYEYYNRAKVFVLSSRFEGSPLVFPEAAWFGNYIISTDIISAYDITNNGVCGEIVEQENSLALSSSIQNVIDNNVVTKEMITNIECYAKENLSWEKIVKHQCFVDFFGDN